MQDRADAAGDAGVVITLLESRSNYVVDDAPWPYGLEAGAKGVQLAALGLQSWKERRWLDVPALGI